MKHLNKIKAELQQSVRKKNFAIEQLLAKQSHFSLLTMEVENDFAILSKIKPKVVKNLE